MPRKTRDNPFGLEPYQGQAIVGVGIEISNAAGGLNDPLDVDESMQAMVAKLTIGDTAYVLLRCDVVKDKHQPMTRREDSLKYVPVMRATDATLIDAKWAVEAINDQRDRVTRAKEALDGVTQMLDKDGNPIGTALEEE